MITLIPAVLCPVFLLLVHNWTPLKIVCIIIRLPNCSKPGKAIHGTVFSCVNGKPNSNHCYASTEYTGTREQVSARFWNVCVTYFCSHIDIHRKSLNICILRMVETTACKFDTLMECQSKYIFLNNWWSSLLAFVTWARNFEIEHKQYWRVKSKLLIRLYLDFVCMFYRFATKVENRKKKCAFRKQSEWMLLKSDIGDCYGMIYFKQSYRSIQIDMTFTLPALYRLKFWWRRFFVNFVFL